MSYQIVDCRSFGADQLCEALNTAFSDYVTPLHLSEKDFREFQRQRGFSAEHSFVAMAGEEIAAFWFSSLPNSRYGKMDRMEQLGCMFQELCWHESRVRRFPLSYS